MGRSPSLLLTMVLAFVTATACGGSSERSSARDDAERSFGGPAGLDAPAAAVAAAPGWSPLAIPDTAPVVAFIGDSIGAGLHLAEHQAFPAVLQARLAADELPFRLVNASESGRTSAGGLAALDWILQSAPDVVVLELGGNDGLRGIELADVERNLRAMIERARGSGARVLLLGMRMPPNYGEYGAAFDALYPALAAEYELAFVPYFMDGVGGVPEMNLEDGLHPTAAGHERLADNVAEALAELVEAAPSH